MSPIASGQGRGPSWTQKRAKHPPASLCMRACSGPTISCKHSKTSPIPCKTRKDSHCNRRENLRGFERAESSTMTSRQNNECYVYMTLPGETESVTAGRFELSKDRRGNALGHFVYGKSYLARDNAVAIDPLELKLSDETYETTRLNGVFGALRDAGPDYWGRRV